MAAKRKPRAAGYIRVSSKDQVEGYSLDSQAESIRARCDRDGYTTTKIYAEEGISGKTVEKRDAFQEMFRDGIAGKFEVVIVWHADRFTRDIETGVASFFGLKNAGIKIIGLQDGFNSDNDDIMSLLNIGIAAKYRKDLIANVKRGMKKKLAGGDPRIGLAGQPIARYWDEHDQIFKLKRNGKAFDEEVREWRLVAKQYLDGTTLKDICDQIKQRDTGKLPHTPPNVRRHLRYGLGDTHTINFDGEVFTFRCEPIVDKATEEAVVKLMDKRKVAPNRKPKRFLLSGDIYCAECGKKLRTWSKTKSGISYYSHDSIQRNGCTGIKMIRVDHIDAAVLKECFVFFGGDKKAYQEAIAEFLPDAKARKSLEDDIRSLNSSLSKYEKNKDTIVSRLLGANKLTDSIIEAANRKVEALDIRMDSIQSELHEKEDRLASMLSPEEYLAKAERVRRTWANVFSGFDTMDEMPWQNRKYLIDQMFDGVDENGRPFGVYVRNVKARVFEYEIYGRFTEGARFMKGDNSDYYGPETEGIEADWEKQLKAKKAAYRGKRKSTGLQMGGTGLEPVTSRV